MSKRTRTFPLLALMLLAAPFALASPPPLVRVVVHNESTANLTAVSGDVTFESANASGFPKFTIAGTIAPHASGSGAVSTSFEQANVRGVFVRFTQNGQEDYLKTDGIDSRSWNRLFCTACAHPWKIEWRDYAVHVWFY